MRNGATAGLGYDQINVTGTVNLGGSTLNVTLGFTPLINDSFTIINNNGTDAVTSTFNGLAEGATITVGSVTLQISYVGGTGNDLLTGGTGNDTFNFGVYGNGPVNMGNDTVTDFADGDKIQIDDAIFSDFADVQAHMQQVGNDVVITYDGNNSITLENTNINSMNANDFLFY